MDAFLIEVVEPLFLSFWVFPITVLFVALDGVVPLVPGEAVVITATVLADGSVPQIGALILAAAAGSLVGDSASYGIGRFFGTRASDRLFRTGKRAAAHQWATEKLHRSGGAFLIAARFVPGGRTATTLCAGTLRYPFRRFVPYASIAAVAWASYTAALGLVAGGAFVGRPLQSVLLGLGLGIGLSMFFELIRRVASPILAARRRRALLAAADRVSPRQLAGPAETADPGEPADAETPDAETADPGNPADAETAETASTGDSAGAEGKTNDHPSSRPILLESSQQDREETE